MKESNTACARVDFCVVAKKKQKVLPRNVNNEREEQKMPVAC